MSRGKRKVQFFHRIASLLPYEVKSKIEFHFAIRLYTDYICQIECIEVPVPMKKPLLQNPVKKLDISFSSAHIYRINSISIQFSI